MVDEMFIQIVEPLFNLVDILRYAPDMGEGAEGPDIVIEGIKVGGFMGEPFLIAILYGFHHSGKSGVIAVSVFFAQLGIMVEVDDG